MVQPNSFLTFNPHNAPGEAVSNTIDYLKRVGTGVNGDCNIDHVGLVWQTDPGLIRAIYHLKANGEFRIQTADMQGNALIAAYDKDSKILWSWHIWVTDYVLDNVGNDMSGDSLDVPGGHVYKWSDYIWMDRGIGAKRAGLGIGASECVTNGDGKILSCQLSKIRNQGIHRISSRPKQLHRQYRCIIVTESEYM
ncbi:hypothetical protein DW083_17500 [Parabacteroides sp. AF48-14]|nr:hypothetical protein DW083_17500 [Parabacteroides sp. AF48-14]